MEEVTVQIGPLPPDLSRAKSWDVQLTPTALSARPRRTPTMTGNPTGQGTDNQSPGAEDDCSVIGTFTERIVPSESTWTLEVPEASSNSSSPLGGGGAFLVLVLYKAVRTFWKSVLVGDEEIDTALVDSRRYIGEYDDATQAMLRKVMFDESQLRRGLPTSDEILGVPAPPPIPPGHQQRPQQLPPGVEYIDRVTLEETMGQKRDG
jgi:hypothetical protein